MIELAPNRKQGLPLANPLLAASGAIGFGGEAADLVALERFGALVTAPISLRPRRGSAPPRLAPTPGGMLLHAGEQNSGWRRVAEQHGGAWARSRAPIIAHIIGRTSLGELARRAEATRAIAGLEFDLDGPESLTLLAALRRASELPILVRLPYQGAALAVRAVEAGADALVCIAPPRGMTRMGAGAHDVRPSAAGQRDPGPLHRGADDVRPSAAGLVEGSLFGPLVRALALQTLREVRDALAAVVGEAGEFVPAVPVIACGGVHCAEDVEALLAAGASAVMVDSLAWVAPRALNALLARDYGQSK